MYETRRLALLTVRVPVAATPHAALPPLQEGQWMRTVPLAFLERFMSKIGALGVLHAIAKQHLSQMGSPCSSVRQMILSARSYSSGYCPETETMVQRWLGPLC